MTKIENRSLKRVSSRQLYDVRPDSPTEAKSRSPDAKSKFWQLGIPVVSRTEVICPKPRRAIGVPYVLDGLNRFGSKPKGLVARRGSHALEFLDVFLTKDEFEGDSYASNQIGYLCGSPPVRSHNPVIHDAEFIKLTKSSSSSASPLGISYSNGMMKARRHEKKSSPSSSCGSSISPRVRVEGFACGSPGSPHVISGFA